MADAMHEAMLDARHDGGSYRRIEVITGQRRRRRWTAEEKAGIVAESFEAGAKMPSFVPLRIEAEHGAGLPVEPGSVAPAPPRPQTTSRPGTLGAIDID